MEFFEIDEIQQLYADSYLTNEKDEILFLSIWGRDTPIQELLGRLSVSDESSKLNSLTLTSQDQSQKIRIPDRRILEKHQCRLVSDIYQNLTQVWIYDRRVIEPDIQNRKLTKLFAPWQDEPDPWPLIKAVSAIPLIEEWRDDLVRTFFEKKFCSYIPESCGCGMRALTIDLQSEEVQNTVTEMIMSKQLMTSAA